MEKKSFFIAKVATEYRAEAEQTQLRFQRYEEHLLASENAERAAAQQFSEEYVALAS